MAMASEAIAQCARFREFCIGSGVPVDSMEEDYARACRWHWSVDYWKDPYSYAHICALLEITDNWAIHPPHNYWEWCNFWNFVNERTKELERSQTAADACIGCQVLL